MTRQAPTVVRAYRLLLGAYPRAFRDRYGFEMEAAFVAERARARGPVSYWLALLRDTAANATGERLRRLDPWHRRVIHPHLPETPPKAPIEMIFDLFREIRYAFRTLRRSPSYTTVVIAVLALGLGANTVVFTLVNALFLTTPPGVAEPERLVRITRTNGDSRSNALSYPDYEALSDRNRTFVAMTAYDPSGLAATLGRPGTADRVPARVIYVTGSYFDVLGVNAVLGRTFTPEEDRAPREAPVVVVAHAFWVNALGADPTIVGDDVTLNGHGFEVVGVAPPGFVGSSPMEAAPDLWLPVMMEPVLDGRDDAFLIREENRVINWLSAVGRLASGVTVEQAQADLDGVNAYLTEEFADWNEGLGTLVTGNFMYMPAEREEVLGFTRLLAAVVGLVLLIVCANVAVLQLVRASSRRREIGIRAALGAGRAAVVRHLLVESLILALAGAMAGFATALALARVAASLLPLSLTADFSPDGRVLAFSVALGIVSAALFGLAPAIGAARHDVARAIRSRNVAAGRSPARSALVVIQIALSLMLVTGAALFVRSLVAARAVDPGFATEGRVFVNLSPRSHGYSAEQTDQLTAEILERLSASPAVAAASAVAMSPFRGSWSGSFTPQGGDGPDEDEVRAYFNAVGPAYFETVGIPLLAGREFEAADGREQASVLIVNEAAAQILWPDQNPIGQMVAAVSDEPVDRVVGLVANSNYGQLGEDPEPIIYQPIFQTPPFGLNLIAASRGDSTAAAQEMQRAIHEVDADLALRRVLTVEEIIEGQLGTYRVGARAVGLFAILAALLAAVGLYGVLSYLVAAETREIGVRLALGATATAVTGQVVRRGLVLAVAGVGLGLVLALALAQAIASMLYRVSPYDPLSFVAVPILLLAVAAVASLIPAMRAARVDPMEALRAD